MFDSDPNQRWPLPDYDHENQPHFLFLLTPPFSGSTAMAALINSSPFTMFLQERGEGQWLVPGLCEDDRWDVDKEVDYESVRAVWLSTFQQWQAEQPQVDVVIEKSPPSMVRFEQMLESFDDYSLLASNRDPYANCASILYRMHDGAALSGEPRIAQLRKLARHWLQRSACIRSLIEKLSIPLLTYEEFCEEPTLLLNKLSLSAGLLASIDLKAQVSVKDYPLQGIVNQNARQMALLSQEDIYELTQVLQNEEALLSYFAYELR